MKWLTGRLQSWHVYLMLALVMVVTSCDDALIGSAPTECELSSVNVDLRLTSIELRRLHPALIDIATRAAGGLGDSEATDRLQTALNGLVAVLEDNDEMSSCIAFNSIAAALAEWDQGHTEADAGRPDFVVIRQTVSVYEQALQEQ